MIATKNAVHVLASAERDAAIKKFLRVADRRLDLTVSRAANRTFVFTETEILWNRYMSNRQGT